MRILMLVTDAFGGFGGIAKFNRDFLIALDTFKGVERVQVWPRLIPESIEYPLPQSVVFERKFARGKLAYLGRALEVLFTRDIIDLVVCGHINLLPAAWLVAKLRGARLTLIIHGIDAWRPTRSHLVNMLAARVDWLISVSTVSAERFCGWSGVSKQRVFILPNLVDLDRFLPGPKSKELLFRYKLQDAKVLLTVGRLASEERYKGFDEVIEALPALRTRYSNIKYLIVGDGPDMARLKSTARAKGVSDLVVFCGRISEEEKVDHYRLADIYVMPSSGEGFGIVLLEAASCGIPVIGSKVDGSAEALLHGELGVLVEPHPEDVINAVSAILDAPDQKPCRNPKVAYFSPAAYRSRLETFLRGVCQNS